jgi:hypothetical protein
MITSEEANVEMRLFDYNRAAIEKIDGFNSSFFMFLWLYFRAWVPLFAIIAIAAYVISVNNFVWIAALGAHGITLVALVASMAKARPNLTFRKDWKQRSSNVFAFGYLVGFTALMFAVAFVLMFSAFFAAKETDLRVYVANFPANAFFLSLCFLVQVAVRFKTPTGDNFDELG